MNYVHTEIKMSSSVTSLHNSDVGHGTVLDSSLGPSPSHNSLPLPPFFLAQSVLEGCSRHQGRLLVICSSHWTSPLQVWGQHLSGLSY